MRLSCFFFSIKDQKQGKCIMTRTSATEDTNRKKRNEMKRWKKQWIQTTVSKDWWYPPAITHEVRLLDSKLKAPRCNRVHTGDYTCIVTYMHWYSEILQSHISSISLQMVLANRNIYDGGKESSHAAVCRCVCENPGSLLPPLKIFEQLSQKKHHQGLKSLWTWKYLHMCWMNGN